MKIEADRYTVLGSAFGAISGVMIGRKWLSNVGNLTAVGLSTTAIGALVASVRAERSVPDTPDENEPDSSVNPWQAHIARVRRAAADCVLLAMNDGEIRSHALLDQIGARLQSEAQVYYRNEEQQLLHGSLENGAIAHHVEGILQAFEELVGADEVDSNEVRTLLPDLWLLLQESIESPPTHVDVRLLSPSASRCCCSTPLMAEPAAVLGDLMTPEG